MNALALTCNQLRYQTSRISLKTLRWYSNNAEVVEQIQIPKRIPRGPTDILRALSSTVQQDPTAAHYKYHDDPYLIPKSNVGKRTFAMAQESGRKSALWVREQHPELFTQTLSDPPVKAYIPQMVFDENSEVSEDTLLDIIKDVRVSDAIGVYNLLESKNQEVTKETKQALLELLCFYNSSDTVSENLIEERWFKQDVLARERQRKTWKDNDMAEKIFRSLDPQDSAAYSALIQGMAKYCQVEKAWQLYEETQAKNIPLTTEVYNSLIRVAIFLKEAADKRWELITELLTAMTNQELEPNIGTLNGVLECISSMPANNTSKSRILQTLVEFRRVGIEPSLASWYHILVALCRERKAVNGVLIDIMNIIEGKEFTIIDPKDTYFFMKAMDVCRNHLFDKDLAKRVDALLHTGDNYNLIGDSYKESIYYRHYFALMCQSEPLETFMQLYDRMVPNIYTPEPGVMMEVLGAISLNNAIELIPRIWSDMVIFDHINRENLISFILQIMVENEPVDKPNLYESFMKIAWDIWTKVQESTRFNKMSLTGEMVSNILLLCLRANEFNKAVTIIDTVNKDPSQILGLISYDALKFYVDKCIENSEPSKTFTIVQYCVEAGYSEAGNLAKHIMQSFTLDELYIDKLTSIVGSEVLQLKPDEKAPRENVE